MAKKQPDSPEVGQVPIRWREEVADHDYASAESYLSLKLSPDVVKKAVDRLREAKLTTRRANDILRAAGLDPAPLDDPGVIKDVIKVIQGKELSPVLVVGGAGQADIADGYHRVSLSTGSIRTATCRSSSAETPAPAADSDFQTGQESRSAADRALLQ